MDWWEKPRKPRTGFCFRTEDWGCISGWEEEANPPLWLHSIIPPETPAQKWQGTLSQHIQYSVAHVTRTAACMAFCGSGNVNMVTHYHTLWTLHAYLFPFHTTVDRWWYSGFTACLLSVAGAVSRCFSKSLTHRQHFPTLESVWSHVTERHVGFKTVQGGSCWTEDVYTM